MLWELPCRWAKFCEILSHNVNYGMYANAENFGSISIFSKFSEAELYSHVSAVKQSDSRFVPTLLSNQNPDCNKKKYNPRHPYAFAGVKLPRLTGTLFPVYEDVVFPSAKPEYP